jgi:hypothetical protein
MINILVLVLGCGPIRTGEEAAAQFIGVHILGEIRPAGWAWYPGQIAMGGPNWTVYPGPKIQPYHNQSSGASLCSVNRPWECGTAALFVATESMGNIWHLRGVEGMANWWPGGPFQWVRPLSLHLNTTLKLGSALLGLNYPGNGEAVAFCDIHFFGINAGGDALSHH